MALQTRLDSESAFYSFDILFESTPSGIAAQEALLQRLAAPAKLEEGSQQVWQARQELWSVPGAAIAKFNVLPTEIAQTIQRIRQTGSSYSCQVAAVIQATGLGYFRLQSTDGVNLHSALLQLRTALEQQGASLVVLSYPPEMPRIDAWGAPGNAQPLMAAIKQQFDPYRILNPGRFVGGL